MSKTAVKITCLVFLCLFGLTTLINLFLIPIDVIRVSEAINSNKTTFGIGFMVVIVLRVLVVIGSVYMITDVSADYRNIDKNDI